MATPVSAAVHPKIIAFAAEYPATHAALSGSSPQRWEQNTFVFWTFPGELEITMPPTDPSWPKLTIQNTGRTWQAEFAHGTPDVVMAAAVTASIEWAAEVEAGLAAKIASLPGWKRVSSGRYKNGPYSITQGLSGLSANVKGWTVRHADNGRIGEAPTLNDAKAAVERVERGVTVGRAFATHLR